MVTSNLPFGRWGETFSDDVVAAVIDRLVRPAEVLTLSGDAYRTRARRELLAKDRDKEPVGAENRVTVSDQHLSRVDPEHHRPAPAQHDL